MDNITFYIEMIWEDIGGILFIAGVVLLGLADRFCWHRTSRIMNFKEYNKTEKVLFKIGIVMFLIGILVIIITKGK